MLLIVIIGVSALQISVKQGELLYNSYIADGCMAKHVSQLTTNCSQLNEIVQAQIAFQLTKCHYENAHRPFPDYSEGIERKLSNEEWTCYTTFFTHVESMCFYMLSLTWQKTTTNLIASLASTSEHVTFQLLNNSKALESMDSTHNTILNKLNQTLVLADYTSTNIETNLLIIKEMERTMNNSFKEVVNGMLSNANNISSILESIIKKIKQVVEIQHWIFDEFIDMKCVMFYIASLGVAYVLTSFEQTSKQRYTIYFMVIFCFYCEKYLVSYGLIAYDEIKWVRITFAAIILAILYRAICTFKDLNQLNNKLLMEMQQGLLSVRKKVTRPSEIVERLHKMIALTKSNESSTLNTEESIDS